MGNWYYAKGDKRKGPLSKREFVSAVRKEKLPLDTLIFGPGFVSWTKLSHFPQLVEMSKSKTNDQPTPIPVRNSDEIDYKVMGEEMQYVEIELDPDESVVAEAGAMMYMSSAIGMTTILGDGSSQDESSGLLGTLLGSGKRLLTGESLFITVFTHEGRSGKQHVSFAAPYPGKIIPIDLSSLGGEIICQKDAFLCAAKGVSIGIHFQRKIGVGLFGKEGFIMQKLEGDGIAFVHAGGNIIERNLKRGEKLKLDTGCLVALEPAVKYDIEFVGGIKSILGGEGLFFATLKGPGKVWLQTLPFSRFANRVYSAAGGSRGEGSLLSSIMPITDIAETLLDD
ncbi:MAG: TIGR00266 family protein [Nitrospinota bacterium]